jgi:hypothetical protein
MIRRINIYDMRAFTTLGRIAAGLLLVALLSSIRSLADTHDYEYPPHITKQCACGCERNATAHTCSTKCDIERVTTQTPGVSCRRSLKSLGSLDHPEASRPTYSRKSNRAQRAQL